MLHGAFVYFARIDGYEGNLPENKKTFLMCTCGEKSDRYFNKMEKIIAGKNGTVEGKYMCFGYDTYGPFKLVGGIQKGHPNDEELKAAVDFYKSIDK